jgi:CHAD domain-containing protein
VHDLRVNLRRLRLLLKLGRPALDKPAVERFVSWSRHICDAAGPVRDLDVALEWMALQPAAQERIDATRTDRSKAAADFRKAIARKRVPRCPLRPEGALAAAVRLKLPKRFTKRIDALRDEVLHEAPAFFRLSLERRHGLRRRVRQWRYLRELDLELGARAGDPALKTLLRLQEAMGELQNLDLAARFLSGRSPAGLRELRSALRSDQDRWRKEIRKRLDRLASSGRE